MGKPRLIILIRHAQSEGNKNREIHQSVPDHRIKLTPEGHKQALEAGRKLRSLLRPDDTLHFFTSPYRRTRETTEGILTSLTSDNPSPSPFPRHTIKVYEEPRLREQDFGNFQPCSDEMERMWQERADYGHFFYRIPNGESAADAYDRVSGFNESLWRLFNEDDFASVCILVTHGLMARVFLMKWYHFSVEYFEDLRNVNHCEFVVMKKNMDNGKYVLQNHLRTWSELRREREVEAERERAAKAGGHHDVMSPSTSSVATRSPGVGSSPIPIRRKWGGCPDGCDHALMKYLKRPPRRQNTRELFEDDDDVSINENLLSRLSSHQAKSHTSSKQSKTHTSDIAHWEALSKGNSRERDVSKGTRHSTRSSKHRDLAHGLALLNLGGRDGGGSRSGANSRIPSDTEEAEKEAIKEAEGDADNEADAISTFEEDSKSDYNRVNPREKKKTNITAASASNDTNTNYNHNRSSSVPIPDSRLEHQQSQLQNEGQAMANSLGDRDDDDGAGRGGGTGTGTVSRFGDAWPIEEEEKEQQQQRREYEDTLDHSRFRRDSEGEEIEIGEDEKQDRSIMGSVY